MLVTAHDLAVDQAGAHLKVVHGLDHEWVAVRPVVAVACQQTNADGIAPSHHAVSRIVGRILLSDASAASQWVWTLSYDYHEDRTPTHGYAAIRDAALHAFARSWNRET